MHNILPTCQSFRCKTVYLTEQSVLLKEPIRIDFLIKEKPRGTLAGKQKRMGRGRHLGQQEACYLDGSVFLQVSLGNLNGSKPSFTGLSCRTKGLFLNSGLFRMKYFELQFIQFPDIGQCDLGHFERDHERDLKGCLYFKH